MNKNWSLSQEDFDALLAWLDPDREQAGIKYEQIRSRLIKIFTGRGCVDPEELADETINRVTRKLNGNSKANSPAIAARYFFGVANKIYMEHLRRKPPQPPPPPADSARAELEYRCLNAVSSGSAKKIETCCSKTTEPKGERRPNGEKRWPMNSGSH